ncbi:MAG: DUF1778 domain-containing protein, partial [Armatimonadaceae bacterium]
MTPHPEPIKDDRIVIRASASDKEKLERAARVARLSRSQFVLQNALDAADRILGDQTRFVLPEQEWEAFCRRLEEPVRDLP